MKRPSDMLSWRERVDLVWQTFQQVEAQLRGILDTQGKELNGTVEKLGERLFRPLFVGGSLRMCREGDRYRIVLGMGAKRSLVFSMVFFCSRMPASLAEHWDVIVGRGPDDCALLGDAVIFLEEIPARAWLKDDGDPVVSIAVKEVCRKSSFRVNHAALMHFSSEVLSFALGDIPALLVELRVRETLPEGAGTVPLSRLPQLLEHMGAELPHTVDEWLEIRRQEYAFPKEAGVPARCSGVHGVSDCRYLLEEFRTGQGRMEAIWEEQGFMAGFLTFPLASFRGEAEQLAFLKELQEELTRKAGDALTVLGWGLGTKSGFLDLQVWDMDGMRQAVQSFFGEKRLRKVKYRSFRPGSEEQPLL